MKDIKQILLSVLGEKRYLALLASSFQKALRIGLPGTDYQDVYFLKEFIQEGNYCVDIGAHLGYYTCELSRLVKNSGKVFAIEPMSKFNSALKNLLRGKKVSNVDLQQVALGGDGEYVDMGIPKLDNMKKFAYARVMKTSEHLEYIETERIKNETGDHLFFDLARLDFIKCDVEGLEVPVFASMTNTLEKHRPILLCELADDNERIKLYEMIDHLGYQVYTLSDKKLSLLDVYSNKKAISHNHYFIPQHHEEKLKHLIAK
ncbi:MAG TPA: FkbM family methyltransferase [Puia sp.]|jgi:FkbM family methyltransferase|nr:FkbM family methyltransferase [Puia sp.]